MLREMQSCWRLRGWLLLVVCFMGGCCQDGKRTEIRTLPASEWTTVFSAITEATLRINNYTPNAYEFDSTDLRAFYRPSDSVLRLGDGGELRFDVPVSREPPYSVYINDLNSTGVELGTSGKRVALTIALESDGDELIGNCVSHAQCICGDPIMNLDEGKLQISFLLVAEDGVVKPTAFRTTLVSTYTERGPCQSNLCAFQCEPIEEREDTARTAIESQVTEFLSENQALFTVAIATGMQALNIEGEILEIELKSDGGLYLVTRRDDPSCK